MSLIAPRPLLPDPVRTSWNRITNTNGHRRLNGKLIAKAEVESVPMRGDDITARLRSFARAIKRLVRDLPEDVSGKHIARQLFRSGTGGGSNYEEARGAESRRDFAHKCSVAAKEMRESHYWLSLIDEDELVRVHDLATLLKEADELTAILTASAKTAKRRHRSGRASADIPPGQSRSGSH